MVSRFRWLGEHCPERPPRAASSAAGLGLVIVMACGFVDGDPIVTGASGSTGASTSLGSGTTDATTVASLDGGPDDTADGSASGSGETGMPVTCGCEGRQPGDRCLRFINECEQTIWAGASGLEQPEGAFDAVARLDPQDCVAVAVQEAGSGRAWARTDCVGDVCASDGNLGQGTLIQFDLPAEGTDLYDVSLVDGFNVPVAMTPVPTGSVAGEPCRAASCAADLTVVCPDELRRYDDDGELAYCASACRACDACQDCLDCGDLAAPECAGCGAFASFCCTGQACEANEHTMLWKSLCPDAITYSTDMGIFTCMQRPDYDVVFCP